MANLEGIIPFLIYFETGIKDDRKSNNELFEQAKTKGIVTDKDDLGGATLVGVTIGTYREYCRKHKLTVPTCDDLSSLSYKVWRKILKSMFWDRWSADGIISQKVADMLVDWVWTSGKYAVTIPQRVLGVKADGIVGAKTLAAVNAWNPELLFTRLKEERLAYTERICRSRPANMKFRKGWIRRINAVGTFTRATLP